MKLIYSQVIRQRMTYDDKVSGLEAMKDDIEDKLKELEDFQPDSGAYTA